MKVKNFLLIQLVLGLGLLNYSCNKAKNEPPIADTETGSSIDAVWATSAIADIEQVCASVGENQSAPNFCWAVPGSFNMSNSSGTVTGNNDTSGQASKITIAFNKTKCYDSKTRDGSIFLFYRHDPDYDKFVTKANIHSKYLHDYGFVGRLSLTDYRVDDWQINVDEIKNGLKRAIVVNLMPENYVALSGPIKWRILGDFVFTNLSDPSKNMSISVDLVKSLLNSNDINIYDQRAKGASINWTNFVPSNPGSNVAASIANKAALVAYTGVVSGNTSNGAKFRMVIDEKNPLIRDFTCYADLVSGVYSNSGSGGVAPYYQEYHPFVRGIAYLTTGLDVTGIDGAGHSDVYPRQIYFGNEGVNELDMQCDNSGVILIKGISYPLDFRK